MADAFDLLCAGRFEEAIAQYTQALRTGPSPLVLANRALAHLRRGDFTSALRDYQAADDLDPPHLRGDAYPKRIGAVLWLMGRQQDAIEHWAHVVSRLTRREYVFTDGAAGVQAGALLWFSAVRLNDSVRASRALEFIATRNGPTKDAWPKPLARYLLGEVDAHGLMALAGSGESLAGRRLCQSCFYAGVAVRSADEQRASALFSEAVSHGADIPIEIEYDLARHELQGS